MQSTTVKFGLVKKCVSPNSSEDHQGAVVIDLCDQLGVQLACFPLKEMEFQNLNDSEGSILAIYVEGKVDFEGNKAVVINIKDTFFEIHGLQCLVTKVGLKKVLEWISDSTYLNSFLKLEFKALKLSLKNAKSSKLLYFKWLYKVTTSLLISLEDKNNESQEEEISHKYSEQARVRLLELDLVNKKILNIPSVGDMANRVNMSQSKFKSVFKEVFNESPHQYFLKLKLSRAISMLKYSDNNLTYISYRLGFSHPSALTRLFLSKLGYSPTEVKRQFAPSHENVE